MTLTLRKPPVTKGRGREQQPQFGGTSGDDAPRQADCSNVLVTYGIHRGRFPIGGLPVREARRVLARLINIHPTAIPVINGTPVDEDEIISSDVTMLSFVKPSALKG